MPRKKLTGPKLEAEIAKSNLAAKAAELDRVMRQFNEIINERDFLRKVVTALSSRP